jgi:flavodoxin
MRILVTYYSRNGNTKTVGEALASALGADSDEIIDEKMRLGVIGYMKAARDARGLKTTDIQFEKNPEDYDIILIGSPIWWDNLTPAVRTYLTDHDLTGKKVGFFITSQDVDRENTFSQMAGLTHSSEHIGTFGLLQKEVNTGDVHELIQRFVDLLAPNLNVAAPA